MSEKLSNFSKRKFDGPRRVWKSFSVAKNLFKKRSSLQKAEDKIDQNDSETSYETVLTTGSVTTFGVDLNSCWDSEESISDEKDYSSIEVPRSAAPFHQPLDLPTLVEHPYSPLSPLFSPEDLDLFFNHHKPIACSTPVKKSTSSVSHRIFEEHKRSKSFMDLIDDNDETITEKPISFISSSGQKNQDVEDVNDISMFLHISNLENLEILELDGAEKALNDSKLIDKEESNAEDATFKFLDKESALENKTSTEKYECKVKEKKDVSVCFLTIRPKHLIPKMGVKDCIPPKRVLKHKSVQKKELKNIPVALECVLPALNTAVPNISVKSALPARNCKTIAHGH